MFSLCLIFTFTIQNKQAAGGFYAGHQHTAPLLHAASGQDTDGGFGRGWGRFFPPFFSPPHQNILSGD